MTNYSRTTLRELKKRYLNILKKCLLANLMAFSFVLPAVGETVTDPTAEVNSKLVNGNYVNISTQMDIDATGIIYTPNYTEASSGGYASLLGIVRGGELDIKNSSFKNGSTEKPVIFVTGEVNFLGKTVFENNVSGKIAPDGKSMLVKSSGGVIYINGGTINFGKNESFQNNLDYSVIFRGNTSSFIGGGMFVQSGNINFYENVLFIDNRSLSGGGGIYNAGNIVFSDGVHVKFEGNRTINDGQGAAINTLSNGSLYFGKNTKVEIINNHSNSFAGAIAGPNITFDEGSYVTISYNTAYGNGGAIHSSKWNMLGNVKFVENVGKNGLGGAIIIYKGEGIFGENSNVLFQGNKTARGGAIYIWDSIVTVEGNGIFNDNMDRIFHDNDGNIISPYYNEEGKKISPTPNDLYLNGKSIVNFSSGDEKIVLLTGGIAGKTEGQINKTGTGLLVLGDLSENHQYEGAFTQTAGTTIANSERFFSHENAVNTINGGELKTHGSAIAYQATLGHAVDEETGSVLSSGTLTHLGTSADTSTEVKGVSFNGTGLNLTLGSYTKAEQEKEIALVGDRVVEYEDENGKTIRYQATDKLFTVKALENDQKAKFILNENLTGMDGNSITVAGAELDVKEGLKVAGKVIAKDMRLTAEKTSSFTTLEVAEKGLLDIQNQTVTADTLSLNQEGSVKVSVHSLSDYGQILAKETVSKGAGTLTMNLVGAPQEGVYKVFEQDTDLKLATTHEFFDIADLENGSYKIARKKADELAEKFGLNEEETATVSAVIGGNSENEAFQKVQTEIMETLKSGNKGKAKKALSAVGAKEHPVEQSVASEHLVALQNVVQAELHGTTVGRAGGDTDPRAKVYIKGLYDRTKSSMGEGFRARSKGAVLGVQSEVTDSLTLGVGYATSQTTAKEELRRTEVDTNTGFVSAHYQPNAWWVSGLATFSRGEYEEEKQILSSMGKASYDVDSWGAQVMTGYDIKLETAIITPEVGMRYLSVKQEGYTDTLGTTVAGTRSDYLTALVGVKGTWDMGAIRPTVGITVGYDVISDDVSALNTLANGASYTVNGEALDRLSTTVTTGIEADLGDRTTLKLEYSGTYRKEYVDHSGMIKFELRF